MSRYEEMSYSTCFKFSFHPGIGMYPKNLISGNIPDPPLVNRLKLPSGSTYITQEDFSGKLGASQNIHNVNHVVWLFG